MRALSLALFLLLTPALHAQQGYIRILVPIAFSGEVPGAFGSRWRAELQGRTFYLIPSEVTRTPMSEPPQRVSGNFTIEDLPPTPGGIFVYVREGDLITLNLRVRDVSRQTQNWGTEIPLVTAEQTFAPEPIQLVGVPLGSTARQTLRVYDFDGLNASAFNVRVVPRDSRFETVERPFQMTENHPETFPTRPGYSEIDLAPLTPVGYEGIADVLITHPYGGPRLWGFVSVTNNETQLITTITPAFSGRGTTVFIP